MKILNNYITENIENILSTDKLIVSEVSEENWDRVFLIAQKWKNLADKKISTFENDLSDNEFILLESSSRICGELAMDGNLRKDKNKKSLVKWDTMVVCHSQNHKIQAIACFRKSEVHLDWLVTHPNNLRCRINTSRIQGAGKKIILYLAQTAFYSNKNLIVSADDEAVSFYERMGFDPFKPGKIWIQNNEIGFPMHLTLEKINKFKNGFI